MYKCCVNDLRLDIWCGLVLLCFVVLAPTVSTAVTSASEAKPNDKPRDSWALDSMLQSSFFSGIPSHSANASPNLFAGFNTDKPKQQGKFWPNLLSMYTEENNGHQNCNIPINGVYNSNLDIVLLCV